MGSRMVHTLRVLAGFLAVTLTLTAVLAARRPSAVYDDMPTTPSTRELVGTFPLLPSAEGQPDTVCFEVLWGGSKLSGDPAGWYERVTTDHVERARFDREFATRNCAPSTTDEGGVK